MRATAVTHPEQPEATHAFGEADALTLVNRIPDPVICAGEDGLILFVNPAAATLFGRSTAEMIGISARTLVPAWATSAGDTRSRQVETVIRHKDGAEAPVEMSFVSFATDRGRLTGAVIRSILDRKVSETMLEEAHSQAQSAETRSRAAHARLHEVIEMQPHAVCVLDPDDRYVLWNQRYVELYPEIAPFLRIGAPFIDILRASVASGAMPEATANPEEWLSYRMAKHVLPSIQEEQEMRDGRWVRYDDRRMFDGSTIGVRVDITDLKRREESFRLLFDENPVPMLLFQGDTLRITAVNDAAIRHYGFSRDIFLHMQAPDLHVRDEMRKAGDLYRSTARAEEPNAVWRHRLASGGEVFVLIYRREVTWTGRPSTLVVIADVTERIRAEARIAHLAHHDALTGVANRIRFQQSLREALSRDESERRTLVLFLLDLDGFKPVNDTYGHAAGDSVLKLVAGRLRSLARGGDTVARLGGDEFAVLHHGPRSEAARLADRFVTAMRAPFQVGANQVMVGVSIGLAYADSDTDADRIMARADAALYAAKAAGKNAWRLHER